MPRVTAQCDPGIAAISIHLITIQPGHARIGIQLCRDAYRLSVNVVRRHDWLAKVLGHCHEIQCARKSTLGTVVGSQQVTKLPRTNRPGAETACR